LKNHKSEIRNSLSNNNQIFSISLLIAWFIILITNFFGFSTTTIQLFFYLIPAFIISLNNDQSTINNYKLTINRLSFIQKFIIFLPLSLTVYFIFSITIYYLADVDYSYGTKYISVSDYQKAAFYLEKAIKLRQEPVYQDKFSYTLAYLSVLAYLQNEKNLAKEIATASDSYNLKLISDYPKNVNYWKTRAKNMYYMYQITDNENEILQGINALKTARNLYPTDPKIPYSLALYYSTLYDSTKDNFKKNSWETLSLKEIEKTIYLKSNYR
jgi:putative inorganic carbon (hco3(-)) transporter